MLLLLFPHLFLASPGLFLDLKYNPPRKLSWRLIDIHDAQPRHNDRTAWCRSSGETGSMRVRGESLITGPNLYTTNTQVSGL